MKNSSKKTSVYLITIKYLIAFAVFVLLNFALPVDAPVCVAGYPAFAMSGLSPVIVAIEAVLSVIVAGKFHLILPTLVSVAILCVILLIYKKRRANAGFELIIYILSSLVYYLVTSKNFYQASIITVGITVISFIFIATVNFCLTKSFKYRPTGEEFFMFAVTACLIELGMINLITPLATKLIVIFIILFISRTTEEGAVLYVAFILSIPFSIYYADVGYTAIFVSIAFVASLINKISPYLSGIAVLITDYLFYIVFSVYKSYGIVEFCLLLGVVLVYFILPNGLYVLSKDTLTGFKSKQLVKQTINRSRQALSDKLYDLSAVFNEISLSFNEFKKSEISEEKAVSIIAEETYKSVCKTCENRTRCTAIRNIELKEIKNDLIKLTKIGMAKGKISFIDLPNDLAETCVQVNPLLYSVNKQLADYRNAIIENDNFSLSRELIAKQAEGVSEMLKKLAVDASKSLKYKSDSEEKAIKALQKRGISPLELLIYGEENKITVSILLPDDKFSPQVLERVLNSVLKTKLTISRHTEVNDKKTYLTLTHPYEYEAVYGVASATKTLSETSGDTHSEQALPGGRFMCAISDGMGSGETAKRISDVTLSLIESFYKAGLSSKTILPLVNKILAVNTDDTFSALDICIVDLNDLTADFIKFGAPRGYIVNEKGIKIVEGNTLPLGIIKELEPTIVNTKLSSDDMLVLMSDGVADAFKSSSEVIDFLKTVPAKNPQRLSEEILKKASALTGNVFNDDMTVLSVRVFKKIL